MTTPTTELSASFITTEQISALKRLVHLSTVTTNSPYREQTLTRLETILNQELLNNFDDVNCLDSLDDFIHHITSECNIVRYEFEMWEFQTFIDNVCHFAQKHGAEIDLTKITATQSQAHGLFYTLSYINGVFQTIGFCLVSWNKGFDFYSFLLIKHDATDEILEIGELLGLDFQIPFD